MINETDLIVRKSGRINDLYYIDYQGLYRIVDISRVTGLESVFIKEQYVNAKAQYDDTLDIYYFASIEKAQSVVRTILNAAGKDKIGRMLILTEAEIEYIRKALINEGCNPISVKSSIKDAIFRKLNA